MARLLENSAINFVRAMEFSHGTTDKFSKETGKTEKRMDMESGDLLTETNTRANGLIIGSMAREHLRLEEAHIQESSKTF